MSETVSVIIAVYNGQSVVERSIQSVLNNAVVAQVINVDDASTDATSEILLNLSKCESRLQNLRSPENCGPARARNQALDVCTSEWVTVLDSDDFLLPARLDRLTNFSYGLDLLADDMYRVREGHEDGPKELVLGLKPGERRTISFEEFVLSNVTDKRRPRGELGFIKPLMRRSFLEKHNLRYQEHMRLGEDYEFYARALAFGAKMVLVPAQGYVSVVRENSLSGQHTIEDLRNLRDCDLELAKIPGLTDRDKKALRMHYLSVDCRLQWRLLIEAVKQRKWGAAVATFIRPLPVPIYLIGQLFEQLVLRVSRKFKQ